MVGKWEVQCSRSLIPCRSVPHSADYPTTPDVINLTIIRHIKAFAPQLPNSIAHLNSHRLAYVADPGNLSLSIGKVYHKFHFIPSDILEAVTGQHCPLSPDLNSLFFLRSFPNPIQRAERNKNKNIGKNRQTIA